jgi:glycerophosphoryl diester phosphodiesterase
MRLRIALAILLIIAAAIYLFNASWLAPIPDGKPTLLAHRGVHQTFRAEGLTATSCTASMIDPPRHDFIENTLPSMKAAFEAGADIVEFDIHPTTDGHFAVFHDWTLDCRTDGKGITREHTLAELKALDAGYGYTADGGKTYPLRGKGIGLIPSLDEVLQAFPDKRFLIHIKSRDREEGAALARRLSQIPLEQHKRLMVYGDTVPVEYVKKHLPHLTVGSNSALKSCLLGYIATGWFGRVPAACHDRLMLVPANIAPWLWGWPNRFLDRMKQADSQVFVLGNYDGGSFSSGIDTAADVARLPPRFTGGIWTNRIESIAPRLR